MKSIFQRYDIASESSKQEIETNQTNRNSYFVLVLGKSRKYKQLHLHSFLLVKETCFF